MLIAMSVLFPRTRDAGAGGNQNSGRTELQHGHTKVKIFQVIHTEEINIINMIRLSGMPDKPPQSHLEYGPNVRRLARREAED